MQLLVWDLSFFRALCWFHLGLCPIEENSSWITDDLIVRVNCKTTPLMLWDLKIDRKMDNLWHRGKILKIGLKVEFWNTNFKKKFFMKILKQNHISNSKVQCIIGYPKRNSISLKSMRMIISFISLISSKSIRKTTWNWA